MRRLPRILALVATTAALLALSPPASADHIPLERELDTSRNMHLVGFSPRGNTIEPFTANSDLAFWRDLAFQGTTTASGSWTSPRPSRPRELVFQECFGNQGDVVVWGHILIRSWNSPAPAGVTCDGQPVPEGFEGVHVFDISDLRDPVLVGAVETECGSHTATVAPDLKRGRLIVYNNVSSGCDGST